MIDLLIKTPDRNYNLQCPSNWQEVTVNQYLQLDNDWDGKDLIQLLSILTDLPRHILVNANRSVIDKVGALVSFIFTDTPDFNKLKRKAKINIGGKRKTKRVRYWIFWERTKVYFEGGTWVKMPKDLEMESFGAALMVLEVLEDLNDMIPKIPFIMAVYSQPAIDGKFIEARIAEVEDTINNMPIIDVYPHCFFFFKRLLKYKKIGITT